MEQNYEQVLSYFDLKQYDAEQITQIVNTTIKIIKNQYNDYEINHNAGALYVTLKLYKEKKINADDINQILKEFFVYVNEGYKKYIDSMEPIVDRTDIDLRYYLVFINKKIKGE